MDVERKQDDVSGNKPKEINLLKLISSRIIEIKKLEDECKRKAPKLALQRLPRFMRRRAASHNVKRIPKFARPRKGLVVDSTLTRTHKLLMRYRRRKSFRKCKRSLSLKRKKKSLGSKKTPIHNWLAKRFKMDKKTHFPLCNNTKNQRSLYRQVRDRCAYFYEPSLQPLEIRLLLKHEVNLEVESQKDLIESKLNSLNRLCSPATGFTFLAKSIKNGKYEVVIYIYKLDQYPLGYICPIRLTIITKSTLLLWIPYNKFDAVLDQLELALQPITVSGCSADTVMEVDHGVDPKGDKKCENNDNGEILRAKLMRFRLIGPSCIKEASRICPSSVDLSATVVSCIDKLSQSYQTSIGSRIEVVIEPQTIITFIYFNSSPTMVDVLIPSKAQGKLIWYELIKNRSHLMGGMRDLELVSVNHPEISRYPWFNKVDSLDDCVNKKIVADILCSMDASKAFVVRDEVFLDLLIHKGHYTSVQKLLKDYMQIVDIDNALLNVEIRLEGKGNVNKYDRLFIPKKEHLEVTQTHNHKDKDNSMCDDTATIDTGSIAIGDSCCGFLENGAYSMFTGCERAYGVLKLNKFIELLSNQPRLPVKISKFDMRIIVQLARSNNVLRLARIAPMLQ